MAVRPNPKDGPAFDEATFAQRLRERVTTPNGQPYAVFKPEYFPKFIRWVRGTGEYDGKGLCDAVKTNADQLDDVTSQFLGYAATDNTRHNALAKRVSALEAAASVVPFGASGSTGA